MATDSGILADSLLVRDLAAAFSEGTLGGGAAAVMEPVSPWSSSVINCAAVSLAVLLAFAAAPSFLELAGRLLGSLTREKPAMDLENNVRLGRERNRIAVFSAFILALISSRFSLPRFSLLSGYGPGAETLAAVGMAMGYLLLRLVMSGIMKPKRKGLEYHVAAYKLLLNILIILAALECLTVGICLMAGAEDDFISQVLLYEFIAAFILNCARRIHLSRHYCNLFTGFLYLCALEFFPLALLVGAAVLF